ncbi:MAG TPA: hypothetical protein VL418_13885 [Devosiaceae bacterium]|nr:hypothetical protein [Devosiaceae bacterium]
MTTISNSMFPLPASWSGVSDLENEINTLQAQLSSGMNASDLAGMGSTRYQDLTVTSQLSKISAYDTNINTVNLRLQTQNSVVEDVSTITGQVRDAAPDGYGTDNTNMASAPGVASQQLDQVLSSLNTDINGHYLFGGSATESAPVATTDAIMNGSGGLDGFTTVADQQLQADQGGMNDWLQVQTPAASDTTTVSEDNVPYGTKLVSATTSDSSAITLTQPSGTAPQSLSVQFASNPTANDTVDVNLTLADGSPSTVTMTAVTGTPQNPGEYQIGATPQATAANFNAALNSSLQAQASSPDYGRVQVQAPASDTTALTEDGVPFGLKLASVSTSNSSAISVTQPTPSAAPSYTPPATLSVQFTGTPSDGDTVNIGVTLPDGTSDTMTMTAVTGTPQNPGEFQIGATPQETAANFNAALTSSVQTETTSGNFTVASNYAAANNFFNESGQSVQRAAVGVDGTYATSTGYQSAAQTAGDTVQWYQGDNSSNALSTVSTKVDDTTNVNYGVEANQYGFANIIKTLAVQSIQTYPTDTAADTDASQAKYDAVSVRTTTNLSTTNETNANSLTSIGVNLGLAQTTLQNLTTQHTAYSAQLQDIVGTDETADPNLVASQLLQVQTQLQASFSATSMISQLQLVNYLK